jgi:hypothetical protein
MGANITTFIYSQREITQTIKCRGLNKMIISDLQYIESADNSEVQGGSYYHDYYYRYRSANANADASAKAFGNKTNAYTNTYAIADSNAGVSLAGSKSHASSSNY